MRISSIDSVAPSATTAAWAIRPTRGLEPPTNIDSTAPSGPRAVPGEHIVVFRADVTRQEQAALLKNLSPRLTEELPLINGMLVTVDPSKPPGLGGLTPDLRAKILFAQPNFYQHLRGGEGAARVEAAARTGSARANVADPEFGRQYHLENTGQNGGTAGADVNATKAWAQSKGKGVIVALADTNIDINHPDLAANIWTNPGEIAGNGKDDDGNGYIDDVHGWNFGRNNAKPEEGGQTHGTHTAGIIAAAQNNGIGGSGVAPEVTLMPLAILTSNATTANAIKAFAYAVKNGANLISNSWGNNTYEPALAEAVRQTTAAGVSVVVAAGNENWDTGVNGSYPDNYAGSFAVAASDNRDGKASYSNRGTTTIDVAAPGDKVFSTLPGGKYGDMSGTSMAAPVVAGLMALVKAKYPSLSMKQVEERVARSVQTGGAAKVWNTLVASGGRVDANAALTPIATPDDPHPTDGPVVGSPVRVDWSSDLVEGQRFHVEYATNATATSAVTEDFEGGTAARSFRTSGDKEWTINGDVAHSGDKSFNINGLARGQQSRLELTETITEPTELAFSSKGGKGGELSFFINRELQLQPTTKDEWTKFSTTLQPGTYTFTWLATGKSAQSTPIAIDELTIGSVSDANWKNLGMTEPGQTGLFWTPPTQTGDAAIRVRSDNGAFRGDWVTSDPFEVVRENGS